MTQIQQEDRGEVALYEMPDGRTELEVRLYGDTVWLSQKQMGELFGKNVRTISEHIRNVFKEGELSESSVIRNFRITAADGKSYETQFYNLDVIISVGYRVKSKRGTQFRIWATQTLKEHLTRGYTLNRRRFEHNARELEAALQLVRKTAAGEAMTTDQGRGLVDVIARYTQTFLLLQRYDEGLLTEPKGMPGGTLPPLAVAQAAIAELKERLVARGEAGDLFGRVREDGLASILGNLDQSVFGAPAYPSVESRAAHCCISSSRTTRSATATNASARFCSWISSTATAACSAMASRSSTTWGWQRWRCWWPSPIRRTRMC